MLLRLRYPYAAIQICKFTANTKFESRLLNHFYGLTGDFSFKKLACSSNRFNGMRLVFCRRPDKISIFIRYSLPLNNLIL